MAEILKGRTPSRAPDVQNNSNPKTSEKRLRRLVVPTAALIFSVGAAGSALAAVPSESGTSHPTQQTKVVDRYDHDGDGRKDLSELNKQLGIKTWKDLGERRIIAHGMGQKVVIKDNDST